MARPRSQFLTVAFSTRGLYGGVVNRAELESKLIELDAEPKRAAGSAATKGSS